MSPSLVILWWGQEHRGTVGAYYTDFKMFCQLNKINLMVVNSMSYARYDSYKDSGVDWLGEIPSDWQSKKLGVLLTDFSKKNNPNMPLLSITRELGVITRDMDDQESNHNFIPDDLSGYKLLKEGQFGMNKMKAWQGSYGISKYTGIVSPAYYVFDLSDEIYPNFFNIAIRSKFYVGFFGSASDGVRIGQWDLNKTRMREIPFVFPSLDQQKRIYEFLSVKTEQIDQAIALKQQQIEKLGEYKQIVIQNAVTKGLDPNAPMKDSGVEWIGDIPEHWDVKKLKYLTSKIGSGITPSGGATTYVDKGIPLLRSQNIHFDGLVLDNVANISLNVHKSMKNSQVKQHDVLLNITGGSLGRCCYNSSNDEMNVNQHVCIVRPNNLIKGEFLNGLMSSEVGQKQIWFFQQGGGREGLNFQNLKNFDFPLPSIDEQKEIIAHIESLKQHFKKSVDNYQIQIDRLKEYKNILINQAVTGKIKI